MDPAILDISSRPGPDRPREGDRLGGLPGLVERLLRRKRLAAERLERQLDPGEAEEARRDHHARRKPRPCGITIHTGVGCSYGCVYCYIWDMGFPGRPQRYPLRPEALAYALAVNPWVVPERTFAAYGSVTEPFLDETRDYAVRLMKLVGETLGLPSQVSTKALLSDDLARSLLEADPAFSVLVTVVALGDEARRLEPGAPPAEDRIRAAGAAARRGLGVALFVRPIIPGVTDRQAREIFRLALENGIRDVVLGSLRVTRGILRRLAAAGVRVPRSLIPREPRGREQVTLRMGHIKEAVRRVAEEMGLRVHPAACSHNVYTHGMPCHRCRLGPCYAEPEPPSPGEVEEALALLGYPGRPRVEVRGPTIIVRGARPGRAERPLFWLREVTGLMVRGL